MNVNSAVYGEAMPGPIPTAMLDFRTIDRSGINENPGGYELISLDLLTKRGTFQDIETGKKIVVAPYDVDNNGRYDENFHEYVEMRMDSINRNRSGQRKKADEKPTFPKTVIRNQAVKISIVRIRDLKPEQYVALMEPYQLPFGGYANMWLKDRQKAIETPLLDAKEGFHSLIMSRAKVKHNFWRENPWAYLYEFSI